jgi:hypothetical protein
MAKTVLLVGDGFNRFVAGCCSDSQVARDINATSSLWGHFQDTLDGLIPGAPGLIQNDIADHRRNTERSAQLLYEMIEFAEGMVALDRSQDLQSTMNLTCDTVCRHSLDQRMHDTLFKVVREFVQDEANGLYGDLLRVNMAGRDGLQEFMAAQASDLAVYTTNYDGISDMVLGFDTGQNGQGRFQLTDGFGFLPDTDEGVFFREDLGEWTQQWGTRAHLHGSYKFLTQSIPGHGTQCRKLNRQDFANFDSLSREGQPVVVFDAPDRKLSRIARFRVLREYLNSFEWHLGHAQNLVLFGISLENDAHLVERIQSLWLRQHARPASRKLRIIDLAPGDVLHRLDATALAAEGLHDTYYLGLSTPDQTWTLDTFRMLLGQMLTSGDSESGTTRP